MALLVLSIQPYYLPQEFFASHCNSCLHYTGGRCGSSMRQFTRLCPSCRHPQAFLFILYFNYVSLSSPTHKVRFYSNNKQPLTPNLRTLLEQKRRAFRFRDRGGFIKSSEGAMERDKVPLPDSEGEGPEFGVQDWANRLNPFLRGLTQKPFPSPSTRAHHTSFTSLCIPYSTRDPSCPPICLSSGVTHLHPASPSQLTMCGVSFTKIKTRRATGPGEICGRM